MLGTKDTRRKIAWNLSRGLARSVVNKYTRRDELRAVERAVTGERANSPCTNKLQGNSALGEHGGAYFLSHGFPFLPPRLTEWLANVVLIRKSVPWILIHVSLV